MNTVPFNYDKIKEGYQAVTKGGFTVDQLYILKVKDRDIIVGVVDNAFNTTWDMEGICDQYGINNLVMIPPVVEKWINVYTDKKGGVNSFDSFKVAEGVRGNNALTLKATYQNDKIIKVELVTN